ncbi:MAG: TRAP transporter substrate-binding protein DctP [Hyphomicrobiales bacterium]|nr:TRAP transporter substrate-binding protein DctP [Hyphomicrobiales bacterium]
MKITVAIKAAAATVAVVALCGAVQAKDLRMLSSWSPANKGTYLSETTFMKLVKDVSKGKLAIKRSGPEAVPPFEQVQPVAAGVFDILITHGAYHAGTTGIGMALDVVNSDPKKRRESGVWDWADKHYQKHGLKALAFVPQGKVGYQMILRKPIGPSGDIKGLKIRGTVTYHPLIRTLGGAPVVIPGGQVYSALEKGVVDGACWPTVGPLDLKWYEVAKHYVRPAFGVSTLLVMMNLNKFKALPKDEQSMLLEAGKKLEESVFSQFDVLAAEEEKGMKAKGMSETHFSKANEAKIAKAFEEGVWGLVIAKSKAEGQALQKFVADKKMGL